MEHSNWYSKLIINVNVNLVEYLNTAFKRAFWIRYVFKLQA